MCFFNGESYLFLFDFHVHTVRGSSDSSLTTEEMIAECQNVGLDGVCLTEHSGGWTKESIESEFHDSGLLVIGAIEINTNIGHVIAIGIQEYTTGINDIEILRQTVDAQGGVLIAAHPFRNFFNKPPYNQNLLYKDWKMAPKTVKEAASHELFSIVDLIEVANGSNTEKENIFAGQIADFLEKGGTGGSDAHSIEGIGNSVTVFQDDVADTDDLIEKLRLGFFYPAQGLNQKALKRFRWDGTQG